jgi:TonB family protein
MPEAPSPRPAGTPTAVETGPGDASVLIVRQDSNVARRFPQPRRRIPGAIAASMLAHAALLFSLLESGQALAPTTGSASNHETSTDHIIWTASPGSNRGGGGGGHEDQEPPRRVELPGHDAISLPVSRPTARRVERGEVPQDASKPEQQLVLPAEPLASGLASLPGVLAGVEGGTSQGPGRHGGAGTGDDGGMGEGRGLGLGDGSDGNTGGGAYAAGAGLELPQPIRQVKPRYTAEAMRAKVQGTVLLECVVMPDGTVSNIRIVRSLDPTHGLDEEAVNAARQWRFIPGMRRGRRVPVLVSIAIDFHLS